jgi:solute carrier family 25 phosphate transporter 3
VCSASLMTAGLLAKYAAAGGVGACVSHAGAVPLDVVKTRVQQDPAKFAGGGVLESAKTLVKEEGWGVLSRGLANTMLGFLLHGAFKYGGFEFLKQAFLESDNAEIATFGHDHRLLTLLVAAALAETVATVALLPLEQTRIKMVSDESYADNVLEAIQRLFREDGVDGFVNSLPPIYAKMIPFSMCQLATYDVAVGASRETAAALAVAVSAVAADGDTSVAVAEMASLVSEALSSPFVAQVPASFLAATLASLASQPGDTLMSVINEGEKKETSFRETLSADARASETGVESASAFGDGSEDVLEASLGGSVVTLEKPRSVEKISASNDETEKKKRRRAGVAETAARLGFDGLYAGWQERLAHVAAVIVIQLVVYDDIKHALIR